jgi:hypothetical protein
MKKQTILFILASVFAITACQTNRNGSLKKPRKLELIDVNAVYQKVDEEIIKALSSSKIEPGQFIVDGIDLTFSTSTSLNGGTDIKLWVLTGSYSKTKTKAYSTTFTIAKPSERSKIALTESELSEFAQYIVTSINAAQGIKPNNGLVLTEFVVNIEYTISNSLGVEGGIKISPVDITPKIGRDSQVSHSIAIKFVKKKS